MTEQDREIGESFDEFEAKLVESICQATGIPQEELLKLVDMRAKERHKKLREFCDFVNRQRKRMFLALFDEFEAVE